MASPPSDTPPTQRPLRPPKPCPFTPRGDSFPDHPSWAASPKAKAAEDESPTASESLPGHPTGSELHPGPSGL